MLSVSLLWSFGRFHKHVQETTGNKAGLCFTFNGDVVVFCQVAQ